jgi:hypothetical protein
VNIKERKQLRIQTDRRDAGIEAMKERAVIVQRGGGGGGGEGTGLFQQIFGDDEWSSEAIAHFVQKEEK